MLLSPSVAFAKPVDVTIVYVKSDTQIPFDIISDSWDYTKYSLENDGVKLNLKKIKYVSEPVNYFKANNFRRRLNYWVKFRKNSKKVSDKKGIWYIVDSSNSKGDLGGVAETLCELNTNRATALGRMVFEDAGYLHYGNHVVMNHEIRHLLGQEHEFGWSIMNPYLYNGYMKYLETNTYPPSNNFRIPECIRRKWK